MIVTIWLVITFLATAFATPSQIPLKQDTRCANASDVACLNRNGGYNAQNIVCNDNTKWLQIDRSITESRQLAQWALEYIDSEGVESALYKAYWPEGEANLNIIRLGFIWLSNTQAEDRIFDCSDDPAGECDGFTTAYNFSGDVYYCQDSLSDFFTQGGNCDLCGVDPVPVNARRIRGGATLHEVAHSYDIPGRVLDYRYGCPQVQQLQADLKVHNADNYHCFALAAFALAGCHLCA